MRVLTLLAMVSQLDEHHGLSSLVLSEISNIHEGTLGQFVNSCVSQPNEEPLVFLVQQARESAEHL